MPVSVFDDKTSAYALGRPRQREAAGGHGITVQGPVRRLLRVISKENLFDQLLPIPVPYSLGAAAVGESKVVSLVRCPQLNGALGPMVLG